MHPTRSKTVAAWTVVALALAGAWVSGTLLVGHDGGWRSQNVGTHFLLQLCESQSLPSVNCADVVGSPWGAFDVTLGSRVVEVPTSLMGLAYFVFVAIWFAMASPAEAYAPWSRRFTACLVSIGLIGSVLLVGLMAFALSSWCLLCVITHALNGVIFLVTMHLIRRSRREGLDVLTTDTVADLQQDSLSGSVALNVEQASASGNPRGLKPAARQAESDVALALRRLNRRLAFSAVSVGLSAAIAMWFYFDVMSEARRQWRKVAGLKQAVGALQDDPQLVLQQYLAQPVLDMPDRGNACLLNKANVADAAARLVVFTDYDCGACACFESGRSSLIEAAFDGNVRVDVRHVRAASTGDASSGEDDTDAAPSVTQASLAAEAARLQGEPAHAAMHRLLFAHRKDRPRRDYAALARAAGLDVDRFLADMQGDAARIAVEADIALANRLGVRATPAVFLNGRRVPDLCVRSQTFWKVVAAVPANDLKMSLARLESRHP